MSRFYGSLCICMLMFTGCRKAYCGDGILKINTEECDGRDFGEHSCSTYRQGSAVCSYTNKLQSVAWPSLRSPI